MDFRRGLRGRQGAEGCNETGWKLQAKRGKEVRRKKEERMTAGGGIDVSRLQG